MSWKFPASPKMLSFANVFLYARRQQGLALSGTWGSDRNIMTTVSNSGNLVEMVKSVLPKLSFLQHKGQAGRIGIIGGCQEYTGAPYFAAISSLKVGADLSHVFCTQDASVPIKSYSPELIVHPYLDFKMVEDLQTWVPKMHSFVLGPGLGRDSDNLQNAKSVLRSIKQASLPVVIDADGVHLVTLDPDVINDYVSAVLTPNQAEFNRLYEKVMGDEPKADEPVQNVKLLSASLGGVTIVLKGVNDVISDGSNVLVCCNEGSPRRCGGQGDVLSGTMGTFIYWCHAAVKNLNNNEILNTYGPNICAAYAACLLTRECNRRAFKKFGRSATTSDMVAEIHLAFEHLFN